MRPQRPCTRSPRHNRPACLALTGLAALSPAAPLLASNHSDAPLIKQDPQANLTDMYAFIGTRYDDPAARMLNVVVSLHPFCEPGDGAMYDRFADDARYSIHITDPVTAETKLRYDFYFSGVADNYKNPDTILVYGLGTEAGPIQTVGDARQNFTQTYRVEKTVRNRRQVIGDGLLTPPPNVGKNVTPLYNDADGRAVSGAATLDALDLYTRSTIYPLDSGEVVWAGLRDDSFFSDIPAVFDLLDVRILDNDGDLGDGLGQDGNGVDGFKGFNVLTFAIQIPLSELQSAGIPTAYDSVFFGQQTGVGVYSSVSRPRITIRRSDGSRLNLGGWMQVSRFGNPLFNEGLVAHRDKDRYNRSSPTGDASFATYAANPELAALLNFVFQTNFAATGRSDLQAIFIPDVMRVVTTTGPVPLAGQSSFNRLGFIGGDTTDGVSSGWPNGRRLGDDVVDIALTAIASGPSYATITLAGDNVPENDLPYHQVFPYIATPHAGSNNRKDPGN